MVEIISDVSDVRLDPYRNLRDSVLARRDDAPNGLLIAEGPLVVQRVLESDYQVRSVVTLAERVGRVKTQAEAKGIAVFQVSREVLAEVAGFDVHRGVLACVERPTPRSLNDLSRGASTILACEGLTDAENLGAIIRSAAAFGADGLLIDPTCADPLSRRSVRVSMGEALSRPWRRAEAWAEELRTLQRDGWTVVALTPGPGSIEVASALAGIERLVMLVGAEGPGLSPEALTLADRRARIVIDDTVDSLNVAAAAAIALYQRTRANSPG